MYALNDVGPYKSVNGVSVLMSDADRQGMLVEWNAELARVKVPNQVTMRQARIALLNAGLLDTTNAAIAGMLGPAGDKARIEWEFSQVVMRDWTLVAALMPTLGLTSAQVDQLFITAATL